ncbi:MAG: polysaccharide biosynthesis/export family protein [Marinifilaceae bacterium]
MRKGITFFSALLIVLSFTSCRTSKDLVYLNDVDGQELHEGLPVEMPEYRIQANDNLYVNIKSMNPDVNQIFNPIQGGGSMSGTQQMYGQLSGQYLNGYQVNQQGNINLPIMGSIQISGLTLPQAESCIRKKASEYLKECTVKVKLLSYKVTVMGEVKSPGVYYNYSNNMTVFEAISMANGVTDFASIKRVLVVRPTKEGSKSYRLNLTSKKLLASEAFYLLPNDVVYVEPDKYKNVRLNSSVYALFLSSISTLVLILNFMNG